MTNPLQINKYIYEKLFSKTKENLVRSVEWFYSFANIMSSLPKDSYILTSVSAFDLLLYVVLVEIYKENPDS